MRSLLLVFIICLFSFTHKDPPTIKVTFDFSDNPWAVSTVSFYGENNGGNYTIFIDGSQTQEVEMIQDSYYITFDVNAPACTVYTDYGWGPVTHYDPGHAGNKLQDLYVFVDSCQ